MLVQYGKTVTLWSTNLGVGVGETVGIDFSLVTMGSTVSRLSLLHFLHPDTHCCRILKENLSHSLVLGQ